MRLPNMAETVVLVVDQDEQTRLRTAEFIRGSLGDVSVLTANSQATARDVLGNQSVDVVVTGYTLEDGNGLELVDHVRKTSPGTGCILYTRSETVDTGSFEDVVVEFVGKETPDAEETLAALIEQAGPEQTQAPYPVPDTEQDRLTAVDRIHTFQDLISGPLEHIAAIALDHFDAEATAVTLLFRDSQESLADTGDIAVPPVREDSLATHTIVSEGGVMAVSDTRTDPRFSETEEIHDAGIVSYLGAAIETADGHAVGVVSVYDGTDRQFTDADRDFIDRLATLASDTVALATSGEGA